MDDNRGQEKFRRNSSVSHSLIKQSLQNSWSLSVHVHICDVRWDCIWAMLSRLVCRNGLHKHDFWEIIKSKIRHSYEAHTYLKHIGFARWLQSTESLFGRNWANGPSVRDKCPCQFSHGRERSIAIYGEWWGETCPHWHVCGSLCVSGTMLWQSKGRINHIYHIVVWRGPPFTFLAVTCLTFPLWTWGKHGKYGYTKWMCSQSLTVLERTISDLQA